MLLIGKNDLVIIYLLQYYNNKIKMAFKTGLRIITVGYQIGMIANTYYMYTTMTELKEINKKYTAEVSKLMESIRRK